MLLKYNADATTKDLNERTPLHYAFVKINDPFGRDEIDPFETVSSLCTSKNCDVNITDNL